MVARELFMLALSRYGLSRGVELKINWPGRLGVAPTMGAPFFAMAGVHWLALILLYVGIVLSLIATVLVCPRRDAPGTGAAGGRRGTLKLSLTLRSRGYTRQSGLANNPTLDEGGFHRMETFPDLGSLTDQELKDLIKQLTEEEMEISYRRRILHGKIDILRAELVNRLRKKHESGELVITGADVQQLTDILAGRVPADGTRVGRRARPWPSTAPSADSRTPTARTTASAAGLSSAQSDPPAGATTATYKVGETGELEEVELSDVVRAGRSAR